MSELLAILSSSAIYVQQNVQQLFQQLLPHVYGLMVVVVDVFKIMFWSSQYLFLQTIPTLHFLKKTPPLAKNPRFQLNFQTFSPILPTRINLIFLPFYRPSPSFIPTPTLLQPLSVAVKNDNRKKSEKIKKKKMQSVSLHIWSRKLLNHTRRKKKKRRMHW